MRRSASLVVGLILSAAALAPGWSHDDPVPPFGRGLVPPPGFAVTLWGTVPTPTSLAIGRDTRTTGGARLYVTSMDGNVYALNLGPAPGPPEVFASGFRQPLGVLPGPDGEVYVSDSYLAGGAAWGVVRVLTDVDSDGRADHVGTVVSGLPNGRHNTNGLAFGPDGRLYIANGNRTDDGIECGPPPVESVECPAGEHVPYSGSILAVDPSGREQGLADVEVIAKGFRNIYDLAFHPSIPTKLYTAMNGPDDPAADDLLFSTDVSDDRLDDMGFPSCLYNPHPNPFLVVEIPPHSHEGHGESLEPQDNPNVEVTSAFGACQKPSVTRPMASFGGHVSADGLAFAPAGFGDLAGDLFVAEWGNIWGLEDGHLSGHKIVRVDLDATGSPVISEHDGKPLVTEFATGATPIDLIFEGAVMLVADFAGSIWRIEMMV